MLGKAGADRNTVHALGCDQRAVLDDDTAAVIALEHEMLVLDAAARGLWVLDAGHHATEQPGIAALYQRFLRDASQTGWAVQARLIDTAPFPREPVR